jgi:hypothetical protein
MLTKYYVMILSLNKSGGNAQEIKAYDTYEKAEEKYFDACSAYGGNPQTGYVHIAMLDTYGREIPNRVVNINRITVNE